MNTESKGGQIPPWVTVSVGLLLIPIVLLCIAGSIMVILIPNPPNPIFNLVGGSVMTALSVWGLGLVARLAFNKRRRTGGLFSPFALRVISVGAILIPITALILGAFWERPVIHTLMAISYMLAASNLWQMASRRQRKAEDHRGNEA